MHEEKISKQSHIIADAHCDDCLSGDFCRLQTLYQLNMEGLETQL